MHTAEDHDCDLNARFGKPSCMTVFRQEVVAECIAALLSVSVRHWPYDETSDTYAEFIPVGSAVDALRALLEGEKK